MKLFWFQDQQSEPELQQSEILKSTVTKPTSLHKQTITEPVPELLVPVYPYRAEGFACTDPGARTPIGVSGNFNPHFFLNGRQPIFFLMEHDLYFYDLNCFQME